VALDRPAGEDLEQQRAADAPPAPPPERPGAEGVPSRAESRAAAAAAIEKHRQRESHDNTPGAQSSQEPLGEERDTLSKDSSQSPASLDSSSGPDARDGDTGDSRHGTDHREIDDSAERTPSSEGTIRDEPIPVAPAAQTEAIDDREPALDEGTAASHRTGPLDSPVEAADDQQPDGLGVPPDAGGTESEGVPSQAESHIRAGELGGTGTDHANTAAGVEGTDQLSNARQATEYPDDLHGGDLGPSRDAVADASDTTKPSEDTGDTTATEDEWQAFAEFGESRFAELKVKGELPRPSPGDDPHWPRLSESERGTLTRAQYEYPDRGLRAAAEERDGEYVDNLGRTYDQMGDPKTSQYWNDRTSQKFFNAIQGHLRKSIDYTMIDLTGFSEQSAAEISAYVNSLPAEMQARIIRIGF
jgi:hypothetical protein